MHPHHKSMRRFIRRNSAVSIIAINPRHIRGLSEMRDKIGLKDPQFPYGGFMLSLANFDLPRANHQWMTRLRT